MNVQILIRQSTVPAMFEQNIRILCDEVSNEYEGIWDICVETENVNGPHNISIERRCHLKARGSHRLVIELDKTDQDISQAVDKAFLRLQQILMRIRPRRSSTKVAAIAGTTRKTLLPGGVSHVSDCHRHIVDWDC